MVIGNCQAGWAIMMLAAAAPQDVGIVAIAGSPLSYWAGHEGVNPMRYSGGLLGGTWLASLAGDLGNGIFDGAWLVQNFENLNPSNTLWTKQYNLYSKVDTEEERYLGFEKWWSGYFLTTKEEMRFITNELFVGNKLTKGTIQTSDRRRIDLRNIRCPIVVLASWGDNITPPPQALNWILGSLRDRRCDPRARAGDRLHARPAHRPSRHLRLGQGRREAACRDRQHDRPDRQPCRPASTR